MINKSRSNADDKSRQNSAFKSAAGYLTGVAREFRDVPTAFATGIKADIKRRQGGKPGSEYLQTIVDNSTRADWNVRRQIKEAVNSVVGKKGTRSDELKNGKYINKTPKRTIKK